MHINGSMWLTAGNICTVTWHRTQKARPRLVVAMVLFSLGLPLAGQTAGTPTENEKSTQSLNTTVTPASPPGSFTVKNPQHLAVPEARATELHQIVQDVVADYFPENHNLVQPKRGQPKKQSPPLVLILGESREHYTFGGIDGADSIYLEHWDEAKFVATDVSLSLQHQLSREHLNRILEEISERSDRLLPVTLDDLRNRRVAQPDLLHSPISSPCIKAMTDASQIGVRCERGQQPLLP